MIILRPYETKLLLSVPQTEWRAPTVVDKDQFGNPGVQTRFRLKAKFRSTVVWVGWFDDRDDADAFLYAIALGNLHNQPALWHLPTPMWVPGMADELSYEFATVTFLTSPTGSNQTYSTPTDWNNSNNSIETLGGGGGGSGGNGVDEGGGGGGAAYSKVTNLTISGSITYRIGSAGTGGASSANGTAGGDSWFNAASLAGSSVGSKGGDAGQLSSISSGGSSASGTGTTKFSGGAGSGPNVGAYSGGGGGSAGPSGAGGSSSGTGGSANNATTSGGAFNTNGTNGTEWDSTHGCGSGAGGRNLGAGDGFTGGRYGGGGSGGVSIGTGGAGNQGIVVVTYTPASLVFSVNLAMLGM